VADFKLDVDGADQLATKFNRIARESPGTFDKTVQRWAKRTANQLIKKPYPATRPGQRYKRTRRLKRGWRSRRLNSMEAEIFNQTPYASFVVGDSSGQDQAWMHRGRWWVGANEIKAKEPELINMLENEIRKFIL
jgi:hypothetical protein